MFHTLKPDAGSTRKRKRVARGNGSGQGTTAGRGTKGQQSRTGKGRKPGFEGGQTPIIRRQPKLGGFLAPRRRDYEILNLDVLEKRLQAGSYDAATLRQARIIDGSRPIKVLGRGAVTKKFALSVHAISDSAKQAIEKAGGSVTIVKA
jgi:large subunit ribosomal protein L15